MLRILHLADLHLGWEPSYLSDEKRRIRCSERNSLLKKCADYALSPENNIQMVIIAGDLFEDYAPDKGLVRQVTAQLHRLTKAGLTVITVPGNHDEFTYRDSVYRSSGENWPGVLVTNPMPAPVFTADINGVPVSVYSLAYTGGLTRPGEIGEFPRTGSSGLHIGAFHCSLDLGDRFSDNNLSDRSLPLASARLAGAGYDYIAMGHYHRFSQSRVGTGTAVYPGAVEFKSFHDPGTGHLTIARFTGNDVDIVRADIDTRKHFCREIDISDLNDTGELLAACRRISDREAMVRLSLTGTPGFPVDAQRIAEEMELAGDFFYPEVNNSAHFFAESYLDNIAAEPTVQGAYVRRLRERIKAAADERQEKVLRQALLTGLAALKGEGL